MGNRVGKGLDEEPVLTRKEFIGVETVIQGLET
jgi:hypothetical protein